MHDVLLLKSSLLDLQNNPPPSTRAAAASWASMYHKYALGIRAGGTLVPTGLNKAIIESQLVLAVGGNFFTLLGNAIAAYWAPVVWAAPGFTGTTVSAVGANVRLMASSQKISNMTDVSEVVNELTTTLHSHALGVTVLMTNISSGITATVTLL